MNLDKNYDYDDIENITVNVVKILLESNVSMEDIVHISGKTEEDIKKIAGMEV